MTEEVISGREKIAMIPELLRFPLSTHSWTPRSRAALVFSKGVSRGVLLLSFKSRQAAVASATIAADQHLLSLARRRAESSLENPRQPR